MTTTPATTEVQNRPAEFGALHWFVVNLRRRITDFAWRHKIAFSLLSVAAIVMLVIFRATWQPVVLWVRIHTPVLIFGGVLLTIAAWQFYIRQTKGRIMVTLTTLGVIVVAALWVEPLYNYIALYVRYSTLEIVELDELPTTAHERIQPLNSVYSLAYEKMVETETPTPPDFVRVGDDYRWTMAIEPSFPIQRVFSWVEELFNVPGTSPSPNFGRDNRVSVDFQVGQYLLFGRNVRTATVRNFGPWRFLSYEPSDVTYVTNDEGEWVMAVSLIRWTGIFFPRPEFGGVQLIEQDQGSWSGSFARTFKGVGKFIPPDEIANYPYLVGQNILSYQVSRFDAESFRYQNGFFAPFPNYHRGDIRIPDLAEDVNDQPFTTYLEHPSWQQGGLYHFFALEPYDREKQGLNTSVFVPADGSGPVYIYKHHDRQGSLTGVSAISAKVVESKKNYDWSKNRPVEHRPYIKDIGGQKRFFWLTTVVTLKETSDGADANRFIAGSTPDIALTDASYNTVVWINSLEPKTWIAALEQQLAGVWEEEE